MAGRGGYQAPANPAPVSGPGALSQRTDGQGAMQLPDAAYGEQAEFQEAQAAGRMPVDTSRLTPLDAPTQRPGEEVTEGNPLGPGSTGLPAQAIADDQLRVQQYLPALMFRASQPDASPETRQLVRMLMAGRYVGV